MGSSGETEDNRQTPGWERADERGMREAAKEKEGMLAKERE